MTAPRTIGIQDVVNSRPVSRFQKLVILLCFLVVAIDGFDTTAVSFIAPALRTAWKISLAQLAPLFGTGSIRTSCSRWPTWWPVVSWSCLGAPLVHPGCRCSRSSVRASA